MHGRFWMICLPIYLFCHEVTCMSQRWVEIKLTCASAGPTTLQTLLLAVSEDPVGPLSGVRS